MLETKPKSKKQIFILSLRIAVVAVGVIFAVYWVRQPKRWNTLKQLFLEVNPLIFLLPFVMYFLSQVIVGARWWLLLKTQKIDIPITKAITLHLLGLFYNIFLPSAVGGDLVRAWYVTKHTQHRFEAVLSIFIDRVLGFLSMVILVVSAWIIFLPSAIPDIKLKNAPAYLDFLIEHKLAILLILAALGTAGVITTHFTSSLTRKLWEKLKYFFFKMIVKTRNAFLLYSKKPLTILTVIIITLISQSILVVTFWLLSLDMQIDASLKYFFIFFPAGWVLGALPVSIGGAVVVEGWLVLLFTQFTGISAEQAFALAISQRFIWILSGIPGMFVHLKGTHLPDDFSIDEFKEIS